MTKTLKDVLDRAAGWPEWAQQDLAELAQEIEEHAGQRREPPVIARLYQRYDSRLAT